MLRERNSPYSVVLLPAGAFSKSTGFCVLNEWKSFERIWSVRRKRWIQTKVEHGQNYWLNSVGQRAYQRRLNPAVSTVAAVNGAHQRGCLKRLNGPKLGRRCRDDCVTNEKFRLKASE